MKYTLLAPCRCHDNHLQLHSLAFVEMRLVLASIIYNFDLKLSGDSQRWIERQKNFNVWDRVPLNVYLTLVEARS